MKKVLLVLIALPVLSYISFKVYVHYKVSGFLEDLVAPASSEFKLDYGWVSSSLSGAAGLQGVRLVIHSTGDEVLIDSIELDAGSLEDLVKLSSRQRSKEFPRQLLLKVRGLRVDFSSEYYQVLEDSIESHIPEYGAPPVNCGDINPFGFRHFRDLGYSSAKIAMEVGYRKIEDATLTAVINVEIEDMQRYYSTIKYDMTDIVNNPIVALQRSTSPKLLSADVRMVDDSYNRRLLDYCTAHGRTSREAVIEQLIEVFESQITDILDLKAAFDLGETERAHVRRYLSGANELQIRLDPRDPIDFKYLKFYKPEDIPLILNLQFVSL
jgi:hypothetical protein